MPPSYPRRKNPTISPPHTPPPSDVDDDVESNFEEVSSKNAYGTEEVDATPIDRQDPSLVLTTILVPIIE